MMNQNLKHIYFTFVYTWSLSGLDLEIIYCVKINEGIKIKCKCVTKMSHNFETNNKNSGPTLTPSK